MFTTADEVLSYIRDEGVQFVDVRFCDLPGVMQHFTVPATSVDEDFFENGQMFDGSSIRGFQAIHELDTQLIPDPATAFVDPFRTAKTLAMNFSIVDPFTKEKYSRDRRNIAAKAEAYLPSRASPTPSTSGPRRSSTSSTTSASRPRRTPATTTSTRSRAPGTPAGSRTAATAATRPATRAATSRSRRSTTTPTCATPWCSPSAASASRSSGPTTRSAPRARPRSTTSSTRCCTPATRSCSSSTW